MSRKEILKELVSRKRLGDTKKLVRRDVFKEVVKAHNAGKLDDQFLDDMGEYLNDVLADASQYVVPRGSLQTILESHPGLIHYYRGIFNDVQQVRRFLENEKEHLIGEKHKHYLYSDESRAQYGAVKTTEAGKLAIADAEVKKLSSSVRMIAYYEHQFDNLVRSLDDLKYVIHDLITVTKENIGGVWINPVE